MNHRTLFTTFFLPLLLTTFVKAQETDIILKGGYVIDPRNGLSSRMDVAIDDGKIMAVAPDLGTDAFQVVDVTGLYVVPGLIDVHGHHFQGTEPDHYLANSFTALQPDGFTLRVGVTTTVDVGGAGWRNFRTFKAQTIDRSRTRVLSFLNIVGAGMAGGEREQNLDDMDAELTAQEALRYPEYIVGVKVAHYMGPEWAPVERAVKAGTLANIPVMVDFGGNNPPLAIQTLFFDKLRPGDVYTHAYANLSSREPIVDNQTKKLRPFVLDAQQRGIIMDVGHGGGSFMWDQAVPAVAQGLKPNTISTDIHTGSMNAAMKDILNVMSKFLLLGLTVDEVIACVTWNAAQVIKRPDLGHLTPGAEADVAVLRLENGKFGFVDVRGWKLPGNQKLTCEMTLRAGAVVYDLNGLSRPTWSE